MYAWLQAQCLLSQEVIEADIVHLQLCITMEVWGIMVAGVVVAGTSGRDLSGE